MNSSSNLHIFFLPFLAPGHMIPMVDAAKLFSLRDNVKVTIVTTSSNVRLIQPSISKHPMIQLQTIQTSTQIQNLTNQPSASPTLEFFHLIESLKEPFQQLVTTHSPDFIISDAFYPWTSDLGIPRLIFWGANAFSQVIQHKLRESVANDDEPFLVTGVPHRIEMTRSKMMVIGEDPDSLGNQIMESFGKCYGMVLDTVYGFEKDYIRMLKMKAWAIGPVSLCNDDGELLVRGGEAESEFLDWLGRQRAGSVLYVCFGSLGMFTRAQLREIALGLAGSGYPFLWVVKKGGDMKELMPDEGLNGLVVTGWVPQMMILNHASVGGFLTHCGWNSSMEGLIAGLPMVTWPLHSEQFFNESLLVDVMGIGVPVGSKVCDFDEEKRTFVKAEEIKKAVEHVMGDGVESDERRMRAKEVAKMAREAVEEGGSSYNEMDRLVKELMDFKLAGTRV